MVAKGPEAAGDARPALTCQEHDQIFRTIPSPWEEVETDCANSMHGGHFLWSSCP